MSQCVYQFTHSDEDLLEAWLLQGSHYLEEVQEVTPEVSKCHGISSDTLKHWRLIYVTLLKFINRRSSLEEDKCGFAISTVHADSLASSGAEMACPGSVMFHDDVIKWKHFPRYWPFVRGIHRSPVNSPHKSQWRGLWYLLWSAPEKTVK